MANQELPVIDMSVPARELDVDQEKLLLEAAKTGNAIQAAVDVLTFTGIAETDVARAAIELAQYTYDTDFQVSRPHPNSGGIIHEVDMGKLSEVFDDTEVYDHTPVFGALSKLVTDRDPHVKETGMLADRLTRIAVLGRFAVIPEVTEVDKKTGAETETE